MGVEQRVTVGVSVKGGARWAPSYINTISRVITWL